LWVKITGQSERVPIWRSAASLSGGEAVVMAGRLLGFIPDVDTFEPMLGTTLASAVLEFAADMPLASPIPGKVGAF
jgi:hypothetical protein